MTSHPVITRNYARKIKQRRGELSSAVLFGDKCTRLYKCVFEQHKATLRESSSFLTFPEKNEKLHGVWIAIHRAQVLGNIEKVKSKWKFEEGKNEAREEEEIQLRVHPINDGECMEPEPSSDRYQVVYNFWGVIFHFDVKKIIRRHKNCEMFPGVSHLDLI